MGPTTLSVTQADVELSSFQYAVNNPDLISDFNTEAICGYSDWQAGISKEILGRECYPDLSLKIIIYINDTSDPNKLYFREEPPYDENGYPALIEENEFLIPMDDL
jgi:hypothetical protein